LSGKGGSLVGQKVNGNIKNQPYIRRIRQLIERNKMVGTAVKVNDGSERPPWQQPPNVKRETIDEAREAEAWQHTFFRLDRTAMAVSQDQLPGFHPILLPQIHFLPQHTCCAVHRSRRIPLR
jgi:hypothetical protein